jgi:hypothetical protein
MQSVSILPVVTWVKVMAPLSRCFCPSRATAKPGKLLVGPTWLGLMRLISRRRSDRASGCFRGQPSRRTRRACDCNRPAGSGRSDAGSGSPSCEVSGGIRS